MNNYGEEDDFVLGPPSEALLRASDLGLTQVHQSFSEQPPLQQTAEISPPYKIDSLLTGYISLPGEFNPPVRLTAHEPRQQEGFNPYGIWTPQQS